MHMNFLYTSQILRIYIYIYPKTIIESRNDIFFEDVFP